MSVRCENCREEIDPEATECPYCGEKRMTKRRYQLYLVAYLPLTAMILGSAMYLYIIRDASPHANIYHLPGTIIILYTVGGLLARGQRQEVQAQEDAS
jgi:DNA-directed RNA polymerase subunit RPC12/RpoP